jgi:hypothetical protein
MSSCSSGEVIRNQIPAAGAHSWLFPDEQELIPTDVGYLLEIAGMRAIGATGAL